MSGHPAMVLPVEPVSWKVSNFHLIKDIVKSVVEQGSWRRS